MLQQFLQWAGAASLIAFIVFVFRLGGFAKTIKDFEKVLEKDVSPALKEFASSATKIAVHDERLKAIDDLERENRQLREDGQDYSERIGKLEVRMGNAEQRINSIRDMRAVRDPK